MENYIPDFDTEVFTLPENLSNDDKPITEDVIVLTKEDTQSTEVPAPTINNENSDPVAVSFFEELKQRGYVDAEEFDGTWETLDTYIADMPQKVLNAVVATMPDVSKDVMKFIASSGDNITKEEMKKFFETYFEDQEVQQTKIETLDEARSFLKTVYLERGDKPKAVEAMLDALEDDGELEDVAKEELTKRASVSKTEKLIQAKEENNAAIKEQQKQFVKTLQQELTATGWKPERVQKVQKVLSGSTFSDSLKEIVSNPKALVQLADLLLYYDKTKKEFDLTNLLTKGESKQVLDLKTRLEKNNFTSAGSGTKTQVTVGQRKIDINSLVPID